MYRIWYFIFKFVNFIKPFTKYLNYLALNFKNLSYFTKLLLVLFYRGDLIKSSSIIDFRRKNYPIIHTFHVMFLNFSSKRKFSLKSFNKEINFLIKNKNYNTTIFNYFNKNLFFNYFFLTKLFFKHFYSLFINQNSFKLNFLCVLILDSLKFDSYKLFNLNFYTHWYKYNFYSNKFVFSKLRFSNLIDLNFFKDTDKIKKFKEHFIKNTDFRNLNFIKKLPKNYIINSKINFSESSSNKFINLNLLDNYVFFFLRKNKIFNKGRYSRNRQLYRTGFYWCLYFNVVCVYGLYFIFYRVVFNYGYIWLLLILFFGSFIFSRSLKYNLYSFNSVVCEFKSFFKFTSILFENFYKNSNILLNKLISSLNYFSKNLINSDIVSLYFKHVIDYFKLKNVNFDLFKVALFWDSLDEYNDSFFENNIMYEYIINFKKI